MKKVSNFFLTVFGVGVTLCLFAGALALVGFVVALCIGGELATNISVFIHKEYFPWVIGFTSISALFGLVGMYMSKMRSLTISADKKREEKDGEKQEEAQAK